MKEEKIKVPIDLNKALASTNKVRELWENLTPIARRDFITWIKGAKQPETRARRIEITRSKLLSGKRRPCCYAVVPMNLYKALGENPKAKATWKGLSPVARRDLVAWVDTSTDSSSRKQLTEKAIVMLAHGKIKYT